MTRDPARAIVVQRHLDEQDLLLRLFHRGCLSRLLATASRSSDRVPSLSVSRLQLSSALKLRTMRLLSSRQAERNANKGGIFRAKALARGKREGRGGRKGSQVRPRLSLSPPTETKSVFFVSFAQPAQAGILRRRKKYDTESFDRREERRGEGRDVVI